MPFYLFTITIHIFIRMTMFTVLLETVQICLGKLVHSCLTNHWLEMVVVVMLMMMVVIMAMIMVITMMILMIKVIRYPPGAVSRHPLLAFLFLHLCNHFTALIRMTIIMVIGMNTNW